MVVDGHKNVPYGSKKPDEIIGLTDIAIQPLLKEKCAIIIFACNTATAIAIDDIRLKYLDQKFIGIESMIKTANETTKTKKRSLFAQHRPLSIVLDIKN
jgi:glutamate racemase